MARNNGRTVYLRSDGQWANKSNDALRASDMHAQQSGAEGSARQMLEQCGGGSLTVMDDAGNVERREFIAAIVADQDPTPMAGPV